MPKAHTQAIPFRKITNAILKWFEQNGRKSLLWHTPDTHDLAYAVWLSEIMLQQTQVRTVIPYYEKFITRFPTIKSLANAELDEVLHYWSGLGYYARARNLHKSAQIIHSQYNGRFPQQFEHVLALPGIGRSTAGAIMAFVYQQHYAILDGNVKRVLSRLFCIDRYSGEKSVENEMWQLAENLTPKKNIAQYTQAIMDLGATICTRSKPKCALCPLAEFCSAYKTDTQHLYPVKKPKKVNPLRHTNMWLLQNEYGQVLLQKRPPSGIWGGLWVPPQAQTEQELWQLLSLSELTCTWQSMPTIVHKFSHFSLQIQPFIAQLNRQKTHFSCIQDNTNFKWHHLEDKNQLGLPAPVLKLLQKTL